MTRQPPALYAAIREDGGEQLEILFLEDDWVRFRANLNGSNITPMDADRLAVLMKDSYRMGYKTAQEDIRRSLGVTQS